MSDWLVSTLIATSALSAMVLLVREPVRKLFGSRVTYGLWLIPAARLFVPTLTTTVERVVPAPAPSEFAAAAMPIAMQPPPQPSLIDSLGGWPALLFALWLAVAAALFVSRLIAYHRDRRAILRSSEPVEQVGSIVIVRSGEVASPIALGIVDPLVVIPTDFELLYAPREQRLVLEHELAHHRSGDLVANLFAFVLLCLQWFNPLAWAAHAAFRFDQEAACDARVLDKVSAGDRADYGRAIAKAASGRALLFASALDRHHSLHRRLKSMIANPTPVGSFAGKVLIVAGIAVALPLTASRAVDYVDVPAAPVHPVAATAPVLPQAVVAAAAVVHPVPATAAVAPAAPAAADSRSLMRIDDDLTIDENYVTIDGQRKRWEELTPAEKTRVRAAVAKARAQLANVHIDRDRIMRSVASVPDRAQLEKIGRDVAQAQANVAESMRKLEQQRDQLRKAGFDPSVIEAQMQQAMRSVQGVDMAEIQRSIAAVNPGKIAQTLDGAQRSVDDAKAELERIQARIDADPR
ncbi:MAG: M56 family metallopeptidase [Bacillota bacterium]